MRAGVIIRCILAVHKGLSILYYEWRLGIPRERGVSLTGIWNAWGVSVLNFKRRKTAKASLEIADLITFPVCKSSMNQPQKQDKDRSGRC